MWKPDGGSYSVQELGVTAYGRPYDIQSANESSHAVVMIGIYSGQAFWWSESTGFVLLKYPVNSSGCYLDDVNDNDEIVGSCQFDFPNSVPSRYATVVYWPSPTSDPAVLPRMSGYNYAHMPSAINNSGIVVGQVWNSTKSGLKKTGARWVRTGSTWTVELLPSLGGGETYPKDVTDDGWVTGHSYVTASRAHAFLWRAGSVIRDLGAIGNESWGEAISLSTSGEKLIVGSSSTANDNRAVLWHPDQ
jgi:probable HAF family extracellular repeat protein